MPEHYPSEEEWVARLRVDQSNSVKAPNIAYHLVGTKKVQQALCRPGAVEQFLSPEESLVVRSTFAPQWTLDPKDSVSYILAMRVSCILNVLNDSE